MALGRVHDESRTSEERELASHGATTDDHDPRLSLGVILPVTRG
jgi:hypothetical protein